MLASLSITPVPALAGPDPDAQKAADAAASRYEDAQVRVGELDAEIRQLEQQITAAGEQIAALKGSALRRAVSDNDAVTRLARAQGLFDARRKELGDRRAQQQAALDTFRDEAGHLAAAQKAQAATPGDATPVDATPAPAAPDGGLICPVHGPVSFVDSWHAARAGGRAHEGVDLMAPRGTPDVAVVSGSVTMKSGDTSGNGVYLQGDNGDLYYYFHLDSYAGGARNVAQGEVIGYTGNTGDASGGATHTHFEIHPRRGRGREPVSRRARHLLASEVLRAGRRRHPARDRVEAAWRSTRPRTAPPRRAQSRPRRRVPTAGPQPSRARRR